MPDSRKVPLMGDMGREHVNVEVVDGEVFQSALRVV
jgi:hypothetical protein